MKIPVHRKDTVISPDYNRVFARYFFNGTERAIKLLERILSLDERQVEQQAQQILREFSLRHRSITGIFLQHYSNVSGLLAENFPGSEISEWRKLLIGSYFTMEYSLESAALFNPSVVEDYDQSGLPEGHRRIIVSLRATGEGHISSLVFRRAVINSNKEIQLLGTGSHIGEAEFIKSHLYEKSDFIAKMETMSIEAVHQKLVMDDLPETFTYDMVRDSVKNIKKTRSDLSMEQHKALDEILWLADSHTEIKFSLDTDLSERVIFPISKFEKNGIEDARFTKFTHDDGSTVYYGTYTAYDGFTILPKLIETNDFSTFKIYPLHGKFAVDKNLALFPRKINGKYAMISRVDGVNNYIMYSDNLHNWSEARLLSEPAFPWEFVQVGNGGSPVETEAGWLLITHGVGPVRKYCLGAILLDKNDPSKVIGRLSEPLLLPSEDERGGYVPNVVYTCGVLIHHDELIIPYAMSDYESSFASVNLNALLNELTKNN